ncbi:MULTISPECIES: sigma 54-interacting transcriptional regulator [unclassified Shewanella]|nr:MULTISPECIES: sigma 54-interacting transcriptional regulator [unclassified Shewanella]
MRFLQEGVISRLGQNSEIKLDVRVIAATHRDLQYEVAEG